MEAGKLVPDELILNLLKEETKGAEQGWLIDGMPRTKVQAEAMEKMGLTPQVFVSLEVRRGARGAEASSLDGVTTPSPSSSSL